MIRAGAFLAMLVWVGVAAAQPTLLRLTDRDDLLGWEGVGRLDIKGYGICSAVLIASDLVLTAAHCVHDSAAEAVVPAGDILFRSGLRDGRAVAERAVYHVIVHPDYLARQGLSGATVPFDVALLRLDAPIPLGAAEPFALHDGAVTQDRLIVASYGRGRMAALSLEPRCHLLDRRAGVTYFDCNITFGSSGAPVFTLVGDRLRLLSLVSGTATMQGRKVGLGMDLPDRVTELKQAMQRLPNPPVRARVRRLTSRQHAPPGSAKFITAGSRD